MKTLEEIKKESEECADQHKKVQNAICYRKKLVEEIGDDRNKLLVYKAKCNQMIDSNFASFFVAVCATIISLFSIVISCVEHDNSLNCLLIGGNILLIIVLVVYYQSVYSKREEYGLIMLVIEDIEKEMDKKR